MAKSWKEVRRDLLKEGHVTDISLMIADIKLEFAELILALREKHRITQAQLAKAIGVSQPYIAKIEDGEENLTIETMAKILVALKTCFKVIPENRHSKNENVFQFMAPAFSVGEKR